MNTEHTEMAPINKTNSNLFEKLINEYEVGISVWNLHKRYGNFYAVTGLIWIYTKGKSPHF